LMAAQTGLLPTPTTPAQINYGLLLWLDEKRGSRHYQLRFSTWRSAGRRRDRLLRYLLSVSWGSEAASLARRKPKSPAGPSVEVEREAETVMLPRL